MAGEGGRAVLSELQSDIEEDALLRCSCSTDLNLKAASCDVVSCFPSADLCVRHGVKRCCLPITTSVDIRSSLQLPSKKETRSKTWLLSNTTFGDAGPSSPKVRSEREESRETLLFLIGIETNV